MRLRGRLAAGSGTHPAGELTILTEGAAGGSFTPGHYAFLPSTTITFTTLPVTVTPGRITGGLASTTITFSSRPVEAELRDDVHMRGTVEIKAVTVDPSLEQQTISVVVEQQAASVVVAEAASRTV